MKCHQSWLSVYHSLVPDEITRRENETLIRFLILCLFSPRPSADNLHKIALPRIILALSAIGAVITLFMSTRESRNPSKLRTCLVQLSQVPIVLLLGQSTAVPLMLTLLVVLLTLHKNNKGSFCFDYILI